MNIVAGRESLEGLEIEIKLVSTCSTPEQWTEWLRVPLEWAAAQGNLDLFNKLLGAGADGSAGWRGCGGRTLLHAAAVGGSEDIVSGLLRAGAQPDVNVVSCSANWSALYTATVLGHEAVARRLVVAGADVHFQDPVRMSRVLNEATRGGQEQLVADLLIAGANPSWPKDSDGAPLHVAAERGFNGIASALLLGGADKDALDHDRKTPLMLASREGHVSVVKTLLSAGAYARFRSMGNHSALDLAAMEGHGDVVAVLVGYVADMNDPCYSTGLTALDIAVRHDQAGAVDALVAAGADVELKKQADDGSTPLAQAAYCSSGKAMLALLQHGAKVDARDTRGNTPLHRACRGRRAGLAAVVDLLLRWGADETALNSDGLAPAGVLGVERNSSFLPSTQDEIERTRLLLAHAPADRTWRRRSWLVMLRSRVEEARVTTSYDGGGAGNGGMLANVDDGQRENCKEARSGTGGGRQGNAADALGGASGETCVLSDAVTSLASLETEDVFRAVVCFL